MSKNKILQLSSYSLTSSQTVKTSKEAVTEKLMSPANPNPNPRFPFTDPC